MDAIYLHRFGQEDYARVKEIKAWLDAHEERSALLAFLQADDPYEV